MSRMASAFTTSQAIPQYPTDMLSSEVFICPFAVGEGTKRGPKTPRVKCTHRSAVHHRNLSQARNHVITSHPLAFPPALLAALHPDTCVQSRGEAAATQRVSEQAKRLEKVKFMFPPYLVDNYAQGGYMSQFGLGPSIAGTQLVSYEADAIPEGFVREDGSLDL